VYLFARPGVSSFHESSRNRDQCALGSVLLLVFAVPFAGITAAAEFAFFTVNVALKHFVPGLAHSGDIGFYGFIGILLLISGVADLWRRCWRNAFLSFAAVAMNLSIVFARPDSMFGISGSFAILAIVATLPIPAASGPTRPQFLGTASLVFFVVAINAGLFGSGNLARIVADCLLVGVFLWFAIDMRRRWIVINQGNQAPLSPTRA
jgi:hypothetical protein